jgi:hypothetical protein
MSAAMHDDAFLAAFEALTLPPAAFRHRDHVRLGYLHARRCGFDEALHRVAHGIRRFAQKHGAATRYNETITTAFMALISQRLAEQGDPGSWPRFADANPDLLEMSVLYRYYPRELLFSDAARRAFILPPGIGGGAGARP